MYYWEYSALDIAEERTPSFFASRRTHILEQQLLDTRTIATRRASESNVFTRTT